MSKEDLFGLNEDPDGVEIIDIDPFGQNYSSSNIMELHDEDTRLEFPYDEDLFSLQRKYYKFAFDFFKDFVDTWKDLPPKEKCTKYIDVLKLIASQDTNINEKNKQKNDLETLIEAIRNSKSKKT